MLTSDVARFVERYHRSVDAFVKGDAEPEKQLFSHRDDVTLANPLGPPAVGWTDVERALDRAASLFRAAEPIDFERITDHGTPDLAFILEIERVRLRVQGVRGVAPVSLRVTTIFRREDGRWRIVHRHADPITDPRSPRSIVERQVIRPA